MRISELAERAGVAVPTVKFYLREGLLAPGEPVNARHSDYGESHLARLRLIRGLAQVMGASIEQIGQLLRIVDQPGQSPLAAMGRATAALPLAGAPAVAVETAESAGTAGGVTRTSGEAAPPGGLGAQTLRALGFTFEPGSPTVRQFEAALTVAAGVGIPIDDAQLRVYAAAARRVAAADFGRIPWADPPAATAFAVLGTALYEPVLIALRRIAHAELGSATARGRGSGDPNERNTDEPEYPAGAERRDAPGSG